MTPPLMSALEGVNLRLARGLGRGRGRANIVRLDRRPSPYASSFALEELDVVFDDGSEAALVMKDLSPDAMDADARRARPAFLSEPRREIQTYRHILPHAPAGTAACYGVVGAAGRTGSRYRLLLERVDGHELRHVGAFSMWKRTAEWIARFHASVPAADVGRLARRAKLLEYDEAFYWRWLERARDFAARSRKPGAAEARRVLDGIARGYAPVVARLAAMPRTVIHGEFYPCNILIRGRGPHARVCPVDWELAAVGPGLIDLAALMTGWDERSQRALARAYRTMAGAAAPRDGERHPADFQIDLDCCRLHLAVRMLGWSETWTPPAQHARDWLAEAAALTSTRRNPSRARRSCG
jgi:aminoglycoside phosphotransferase (APT) family kinase protein